jgi:hypothetical protein
MMARMNVTTGAGGCRIAAPVLPVIIHNEKFPA